MTGEATTLRRHSDDNFKCDLSQSPGPGDCMRRAADSVHVAVQMIEAKEQMQSI